MNFRIVCCLVYLIDFSVNWVCGMIYVVSNKFYMGNGIREIAGNNMLDAWLHGTALQCLPISKHAVSRLTVRHHKQPQGSISQSCLFLFQYTLTLHVLFLSNPIILLTTFVAYYYYYYYWPSFRGILCLKTLPTF